MATSGRSADGAAPLYTLRGEPLPWGSAPFPEDASPARTTRAKPFAMEVYFEQMWRDPANEHLAFALERATCPILIVSGTDDGLWPSTLGGQMIADRLARQRAPQLVRHVVNQGAGHLFNLPLQVESCAQVICHPVQRWWLRAGGTPRANANAALRSWEAMQDFLRETFDGRTAGGAAMMAFLTARLFQALLVLFVMSLLVFVSVYAIGNPVDMLIAAEATQEEREMMISRLGLDQPLALQYLTFLKGLLERRRRTLLRA